MLIRSEQAAGPALPEVHHRLRWIIIVVVLAFLLLLGRLWQLQVMHGEEYYEQTLSNVVHERFLPSIRGKILDRRGHPLADNRPAFNIYVTPHSFSEGVRTQLIRLLGLSDDEITRLDERVAAGRERQARRPVLAFEDQSRKRAALVKQSGFQLPGIEVHDEPYRFYPEKDLGAHLVGYMNQMTSTELEKYGPLGYDASELVGRYGLERAFENYLRGKKGIERYAVNARGQRIDAEEAAELIEGDRVIEPVAGHNLVLTIDAELQRASERAVRRHPAAAIAVIEVDTGRVLALVSRPSFEPNTMTGHLTKAEDDLLKADPRKPYIDKNLRQHYPPGSTYKFVVALAALEDGVIDEEEQLTCPGSHSVGRQRFRCTSSHGKVNMTQAIQHSCNVYFWKLAEQVGMDRMAEVAHDFGFGAPTGLGLNGDISGRVPTRLWYEERTTFKIGYTINAATGQGDVELTVLQLAMAYAALVNGGKLHVPQVVRRIETARGETVIEYQPRLRRELSLRNDNLDLMRRGMWMVVNELGGTAFEYARSASVEYAGKTGTAEVRGKRRRKQIKELDGWHPYRSHAWFAGYAPADRPEIAIAVLIEHGGQGGKIAAPVAKRIIETYFSTIKPAMPDRRPADQQTANRPTADRPTADQPTADQPTANQPTANRPTMERGAP